MEIAEQTGREREKEKPYAEEITKTGGKGPKNMVENKRQENQDIEK
jgi:hypothetical protein